MNAGNGTPSQGKAQQNDKLPNVASNKTSQVLPQISRGGCSCRGTIKTSEDQLTTSDYQLRADIPCLKTEVQLEDAIRPFKLSAKC